MAVARKCNVCQCCFDPMNQGNRRMARFKNPIFQNSMEIKNNDVGHYLIEDSIDEWIDLCPDCTEKFEAFMDGNPLSLHENDFDQPDISGKNEWLNRFLTEVENERDTLNAR